MHRITIVSLLLACSFLGWVVAVKGRRLHELSSRRAQLTATTEKAAKADSTLAETQLSGTLDQPGAGNAAWAERVGTMIAQIKASSVPQVSREERAVVSTLLNPYPELMGDPAYDQLVKAYARGMAQRYMDHYARMGLTEETLAAVENKLVERFMSDFDARAVVKELNVPSHNPGLAHFAAIQGRQEIDEQLKELTGVDPNSVERRIGNGDYQKAATLSERISARLSYSAEPLTTQELDKMTDALWVAYAAGVNRRAMEWEPQFYDGLSAFLSPLQINAVKDVQRERAGALRARDLAKTQGE